MPGTISRREAIAGAGAASVAAIFPAMAQPLTGAQLFGRDVFERRYSSIASMLARYEAIQQPTPADQAIATNYRLCRDQAIDALAEFDRGAVA